MGVTIVGVVGWGICGGVRERRRLDQQVIAAAHRDALTGLLNRSGFLRAYESLEPDAPLTLAMLDLNDLKAVNDLGGHSAGDAHIRAVAERLRTLLPAGGAAALWGGDEFALLLPHTFEGAALRELEVLSRTSGKGDAPAYAVGTAKLRAGEPLGRALALADARMYEEKARQHLGYAGFGRTASFEAVVAEIERLEEPKALVRVAFTLAQRDLGFDAALYYRATAAGFSLTDQTGDLPAAFTILSALYPPRASVGLCGLAIGRGVPTWAEDYQDHPKALAYWTELGLKSCLVTPVQDKGQVVGLLSFLSFNSWHAITPQARRAVQAVTLRLGHILERERPLTELRRSLEGGLLGLGIALEARDIEIAGHTKRVVALADRLGRVLALPNAALDALQQGAYLHDIGKLTVPDHILLKPGELTPDEWAVVRSHSTKGYEIARTLPGLDHPTLEVIRYHHERWDGAGYPDGMVGETTPLLACIFAVCDVFDALTSERPYKRAQGPKETLAEITARAGRQFDPKVVAAFVRMIRAASVAEPAERV